MGRIFTYLILGAIGGFAGWAIIEPINSLTPVGQPGQVEPSISFGAMLALGLIIGLTIGTAIGFAQAKSGVSMRDGVKSVFISGLIGACGGMFGMMIGSTVYGTFRSAALSGAVPGPIAFILLLIGRSVGWAVLGAVTGIALGIASSSSKKMVNGVIGGLVGGGISGAGFQILAQLVEAGILPFTGPILRAISFTATGAAIGLFIGFIEELTKQAWLKLLKGRNEGKEFILYKPLTILGRDELADVPVFGDTSVAPQHAAIELKNNRYILRDMGAPFGTSINGNRVSEHILKDSDVIELGSMKLVFYEKATASRVPRYVEREPVQSVNIPTSSAVCMYCGGVKDANGNCLCTVGSGAPQPPAQQNPFQQQPVPQQPAAAPYSSVPDQFPPDPFLQPAVVPAGTSSGEAKLVGMDGTYFGQTFVLKPGDTTIGRDPARDIALVNDKTVSRSHARISGQSGGYTISDEGSSNGTTVNGSKISSIPLRNGDIIQIGSTRFRFEE